MAISDGVRLVMAVNVRIIRPHDETLYLIGDEMENAWSIQTTLWFCPPVSVVWSRRSTIRKFGSPAIAS
jgi:hypothetical protein